MENDLYQKKYQYERFIKNLNDILLKLNKCYVNLITAKKTIEKTLKIEDNYYDDKKFEKIIMDVSDHIDNVKNILLPKAKDEYNNILLEISKL
jgi:protein subunit release factor A